MSSCTSTPFHTYKPQEHLQDIREEDDDGDDVDEDCEMEQEETTMTHHPSKTNRSHTSHTRTSTTTVERNDNIGSITAVLTWLWTFPSISVAVGKEDLFMTKWEDCEIVVRYVKVRLCLCLSTCICVHVYMCASVHLYMNVDHVYWL